MCFYIQSSKQPSLLDAINVLISFDLLLIFIYYSLKVLMYFTCSAIFTRPWCPRLVAKEISSSDWVTCPRSYCWAVAYHWELEQLDHLRVTRKRGAGVEIRLKFAFGRVKATMTAARGSVSFVGSPATVLAAHVVSVNIHFDDFLNICGSCVFSFRPVRPPVISIRMSHRCLNGV